MRSPCFVFSFLCRTCLALVALVVDMAVDSVLKPADHVRTGRCLVPKRSWSLAGWSVLSSQAGQQARDRKKNAPQLVSRAEKTTTATQTIDKIGIKKHVENQVVLCASFVIFAMGRAVLSMDGCAAKRRPRGLQLFAVEAGADISGTERSRGIQW